MGAIVWLASYPKSGNTWTRAFIVNLLKNPPKPVDINQLDQFNFGESGSKFYVGPAYNEPMDRDHLTLTDQDVQDRRATAHALLTQASPDSVFVKTHNLLGEWLGQPLHNMAVTAAAVYVVRNPLDVVISMTDHFGLDIDGAIDRLGNEHATTDLTKDHVPEYHSSWSMHVNSWTQNPNPQLYVMRYEDMKAKPFKTFMGLAKFLGLNPPKERINKAIKFSDFKELKKQEREKGFGEKSEHATQFFGRGTSGHWKSVLTDEQVDRICNEHAEMMAKFDYLPKSHKHLADQFKNKKSA